MKFKSQHISVFQHLGRIILTIGYTGADKNTEYLL